jgi:hypothetical protein
MQERYTHGLYSCLKYSIWIRLFNKFLQKRSVKTSQNGMMRLIFVKGFLLKAWSVFYNRCNCTFFYHIHMDFHDFYGNSPVGLAALLSAVTAMLLLPQTKYRAKQCLAIMSGCLLHSVDTCFVLLVYICLLVHITYTRGSKF